MITKMQPFTIIFHCICFMDFVVVVVGFQNSVELLLQQQQQQPHDSILHWHQYININNIKTPSYNQLRQQCATISSSFLSMGTMSNEKDDHENNQKDMSTNGNIRITKNNTKNSNPKTLLVDDDENNNYNRAKMRTRMFRDHDVIF